MLEFVAERLRKLKPSRKDAVLNSIGAMFQFRSGISEQDKETMFAALVTARAIVITENGKVTYPEGWGRTDGGHRANDRSAACLHD